MTERQENRGAILAKYKNHLKSFGTAAGIERQIVAKMHMEDTLVKAVNNGFEKKYGDDVTFGIAAVAEIFNMWNIEQVLNHQCPEANEHETIIQGIINDVAEWLPSEFYKRTLGQGLKRTPLHSTAEYAQLLKEAEKEMPVVQQVMSLDAPVPLRFLRR